MSRNSVLRIGLITALAAASFSTAARAQEFVYDAQGKRNPFIPIVTPDGRYQKLEVEELQQDAGLKLEGIIYDKYGISYAVVDGTVVRIGDMAGEYQVLKIEEKKVIFMREGQEKTVELKKEGP
jgi:hypothetical protein